MLIKGNYPLRTSNENLDYRREILKTDNELRIISAEYPQDFEAKINERLAEGCWRIAETEMSVTDHHYWAMLIKCTPDSKGESK